MTRRAGEWFIFFPEFTRGKAYTRTNSHVPTRTFIQPAELLSDKLWRDVAFSRVRLIRLFLLLPVIELHREMAFFTRNRRILLALETSPTHLASFRYLSICLTSLVSMFLPANHAPNHERAIVTTRAMRLIMRDEKLISDIGSSA